MIRKITISIATAALLATLGGCNTVKGLGRDIQSVGQAGDNAINK